MKQLIFVLALFTVCHPLVNGQDSTCAIIWDPPVLLSDSTYDAQSPKIALTGDDTLHITWENAGKIRLPYVRSVDGGRSFETPRELLEDSNAYPWPASWVQVVAQNSKAYVFFKGTNGSGWTPVRMLVSEDAGSSWDSVRDISVDLAGEIRSASVCGDSLAIVYARYPGVKVILRSSDRGATWSQTDEGLNYFARAALSSGILHLVQLGAVGNMGETEYRRSSNLGDTWSQRTFLSTLDGLQSQDPTIAASTRPTVNGAIAAWRDPKYGCLGLVGCSIIIRQGIVGSDSTVWLPEQVLSDIPAGYEPSLAVNGCRMVAAWPMDEYSTPFSEVRVSTDTSWCSISDPTNGVTTRIVVSVAVAVTSKATHVVWCAYQRPDPSTLRIFYRRGRFIDTDVKDRPILPPPSAQLQQNYPNPFNPSTEIAFTVDHSSFVTVKVYDILGSEVTTLVNEWKQPGAYRVTWDARNTPSGVYYYRLVTGTRVEIKKAILLR